MLALFRSTLALFAALTLVTGVLYPLAVTGVAHLLFPARAAGSLIVDRGRVRGSSLIAQWTRDPADFWPRPSVTVPPDDPTLSAGSNMGPTNPARFDSL